SNRNVLHKCYYIPKNDSKVGRFTLLLHGIKAPFTLPSIRYCMRVSSVSGANRRPESGIILFIFSTMLALTTHMKLGHSATVAAIACSFPARHTDVVCRPTGIWTMVRK